MPIDYAAVMAYRSADIPVRYGPRDCAIYALGIGLGMDPLDEGQLKFVCEPDVAAFPTLPVVLGWPGRMMDPKFGIDPRMIVASELRVTLHRPLQPRDELVSRPRIREVIDKGPGSAAIILATRNLMTPGGETVATVDTGTLARKHGGFGGKVTEAPPAHEVPTSSPDQTIDLPTPPNLALIYRLTGDDNPLHSDPARARAVGFERPILHGAASFGVAAHAVVRAIGYDADKIASIEARFVKPVFPGDTLRTDIWRDGNQISFQCRAVGRDGIVLSNGLAVLRA